MTPAASLPGGVVVLGCEKIDVFAIGLLRSFVNLPQWQRLSGFYALYIGLLWCCIGALLRFQSKTGLATGHRKVYISKNARIEQCSVQATIAIIYAVSQVL